MIMPSASTGWAVVAVCVTRLGCAALSGGALCSLFACGSQPAVDHLSAPTPAGGSPACITRRAAFDIGSATTKVKVAEIDRCQSRELKLLYAEEAPVFYRDDVQTRDGASPHITTATMDRGLQVLTRFKAQAENYDPQGFAGVATSAFRRADNGSHFASEIRDRLGISVRVIDQSEEAYLGFMGAVRQAHVTPEKAVVWDVGGRSMQMTTLADDGHVMVYRGKFASGQMRDHLVRVVQKKPPEVLSPNPLTTSDVEAGLDYAHELARRDVPAPIRTKLADPETVVVGIGALKYYGTRPADEPGARCDASHLAERISDLTGKTDEQIGGDYAATQISDRVLFIGFMKALSVRRVVIVDVDLTDGLLFEGQYWDARGSDGILAP